MRQLNTLRNQMLFLIFAAVVLGTAISLYFRCGAGGPSMRSRAPCRRLTAR